MKTLLLVLTLLTVVTPMTRGATVFVLPNAARATNLTLVGGSATGLTNTGGTFTGGTFSLSTNTGVTASRAVVSDSAQRITNSVTTATELGYVSGVTSAIQTQLGTKAPTASPTFTGIVSATNIANALGLVATPSYTFTGDENTGLWSSGADTVNFSTGGSERARIDSSGRLQIGGSAGDQLVNINSLGGNAMVSFIIASSTKVFTGISANNDTPVMGMTTGDYGIRVQGTNDIFLSANGGSSGQFVLKNSGNVGIGNATPQYLLDVAGQARLTGTNGVNFGGTTAAADKTVTIHQSSANVLALTATTTTVSGGLTIAGTTILTQSSPPASAAAAGTVGTIAWDADYIYICTAANTWKRVAIATW